MTLLCCYDLSISPPTYDAVGAACQFERERIRRREPDMEIAIAPGPVDGFRRDRFWPYGKEAREAMLDAVAIPIFKLLPACARVYRLERPIMGPRSTKERFVAGHGLAQLVYAGVRPLRAPLGDSAAVRQDDLVTITLREAEHWPSRNSNVPAWLEAAREIKRLGLQVTFVRDTLKAGTILEGGEFEETCADASLNLPARARLYASARLNMGVSQGPMWLAAAMDVPTMIMRPFDSVAPCCTPAYYRAAGIPAHGFDVPGMPNVTLCRETDSAANILATFGVAIRKSTIATTAA